MYVGNRFKSSIIWFWARRNLAEAVCVSGAVYTCYEWLGWKQLSIPFLPIATIGTAVAFYVGFKNNSSYDRLWEGRRIWGAITNVSRAWAALVLSLLKTYKNEGNAGDADSTVGRDAAKQLVYRQIAWVNALRLQLRQRPAPHRKRPEDLMHVAWVKQAHIEDALAGDAQIDAMLEHFSCKCWGAEQQRPSNVAAALLGQQAAQVAQMKRDGWLDGFEHTQLMNMITECYTQQGAAERIKSFPFPRQYAIFSRSFVKIFIFLLPFGLMKEMAQLGKEGSWLLIPFSMLISWVFYTMEQVGDSSEDPFEGGVNDVPLSTICRNIEVDLREMLKETNLPARLQPVEDVLL